MKLFDDGTFFLRSPSCKEAPRAASWGFLFSFFFFLESCETERSFLEEDEQLEESKGKDLALVARLLC